MRALAFVAAAGLACSLWAGAVAAPVTIAFTGTLIQAPTLDPADPFGGAIDTGTAFAGRYTFDAAAPDGAADARTGSYHSVGAPYGLSVEFGGPGVFGVSFDEMGVGIGNDFSGADFYTFVAPVVAPALGLSASLVMMDSDGSVFDSDALPLGAPTLGAFESAQFSLSGSLLNADGSTTQIELLGSVETLACSAGCGVPEPGSLLLAAAGLAALRVQRRARPGTGRPDPRSLEPEEHR